jgi:hypothetical protein
MIHDVTTRRRIGRLEISMRNVQREASKVSFQRLVASVLPFSGAKTGLKARHEALVKMAADDRAEIERLREEAGDTQKAR